MQQLKNISDKKIGFSFHVDGTCYVYEKDNLKNRILYQDNKGDLFYKKSSKKIYLNKKQIEIFNKTQ